jgi:hypothetical protein
VESFPHDVDDLPHASDDLPRRVEHCPKDKISVFIHQLVNIFQLEKQFFQSI